VQGTFYLLPLGTWSAPLCVDSGTATVTYSGTLGGSLTVSQGAKLRMVTNVSLAVGGTVTNLGALEQVKDVGTDNTAFLYISTDRYYGAEKDPTGAGGMSYTTVTVWGNQLCPNAYVGVQRCFAIVPTTAQTADVKFYFTEAERNGETLANLKVWHWEDPDWVMETGTVTTGGSGNAQWVKVTGVDSYSSFMLAGSDPTAVMLTRFEAWPEGSGKVHVQWETAQEIENLGFNLYRSDTLAGRRTKLNKTLIPSLVPPGAPYGTEYDWIDRRVRPSRTYFYWLEDVDIYGRATLHGPVEVLTIR
jgi:hypothetical protein